MIHITVPSTTTLVERIDGVTKYTAFNIHINGWLHASIRYSLLYKLADTVKHHFGARFSLPEFPPKKLSLMRLEGSALDERRLKIGKYLQTLVQQGDIIRSPIVERTFLEFQLESYRPAASSVTLDVLLGDATRLSLKCGVLLSTREVMKVLTDQLECDFDLFYQYWGLFLVKTRREGAESQNYPFPDGEMPDLLAVRLLRNFESPYVSLQLANQRAASLGIQYKIQLRRMVWDAKAQEKLYDHPALKELLYKQASCELHNGLLQGANAEAAEQMELLNSPNNSERFLRVCSQQASYGYEDLGEAECDMPSRSVRVKMKVGRRQLLLVCAKTGTEWIFRATRIRIWRISQPVCVVDPLVFQFEYLIGREQFEWVTIHTDQAILLSLLLQSIGADILNEHHEAAKELARQALGDELHMPRAKDDMEAAKERMKAMGRDDKDNGHSLKNGNGISNGYTPLGLSLPASSSSSTTERRSPAVSTERRNAEQEASSSRSPFGDKSATSPKSSVSPRAAETKLSPREMSHPLAGSGIECLVNASFRADITDDDL